MRKVSKFILASCLIAGGVVVYFKGYKDRWCLRHQVTFKTEQPIRRDIVCKKVFYGNLIPCKEIKLESHITGIVEKLLVRVGDYVQQGAAIARIKIQPNTKEIEAAESSLRLASIKFHKAKTQYLRNKQLFGKKMLAKETYESFLATWEEAKEQLSAAEKQLQVVQCGYTKDKGVGANIIKATTKGTILDLPHKEGDMVQVMNAQRSEAVVAVIGDMEHFLFSAKVSELDVVHLTKGMSFEVTLNAFQGERFQVTLTKISPKASEDDLKQGEVKFEIEGVITKPKNSKIPLRAGYVALAEVVVQQAPNVLTVQEKMIHTEGKTYFVNCLHEGESIRKDVVLGLSDGLYVEVKEGLTEADCLIVEE